MHDNGAIGVSMIVRHICQQRKDRQSGCSHLQCARSAGCTVEGSCLRMGTRVVDPTGITGVRLGEGDPGVEASLLPRGGNLPPGGVLALRGCSIRPRTISVPASSLIMLTLFLRASLAAHFHSPQDDIRYESEQEEE